MNRIVATMDDLPELPFEKVLSYLSLQDRLKSRAVSRRWYHKINSFKVKSLCYSDRPIDCILRKNRWISGAFAENFISSIRFESFFKAYGQSVFSNLKHLRFCDLRLDLENRAAFTRTLNSFGQLEQLDIIRAKCVQGKIFKLNLSTATSIHLENLLGIEKLILDAPRLRKVSLLECSGLRLQIVHGESVESLITTSYRDRLQLCGGRLVARRGYPHDQVTVKSLRKLRNLKYLVKFGHRPADPTLLFHLKHLKELHVEYSDCVSELFEQKQRYGRTDLKIYLCGMLLNGPDDPARNALRCPSAGHLNREAFGCLVENPSRLADVIPIYRRLSYSDIEPVAPGLQVDVLNRLADLTEITVNDQVRDIEHFLELLKNWENIVELQFGEHPPPQDLLDRLPDNCAVQRLTLTRSPSDLGFLFRLKHLIHLFVNWTIDVDFVRKAFEELQFLSSFGFEIASRSVSTNTMVQIEIDSKRFCVSVGWTKISNYYFHDLNAAIKFIARNGQQKRKAEEMQ